MSEQSRFTRSVLEVVQDMLMEHLSQYPKLETSDAVQPQVGGGLERVNEGRVSPIMSEGERKMLQKACQDCVDGCEQLDLHFKHPFNMVVAGPSQSGKSYFVRDILTHQWIHPYPEKIVWAYAEWQSLYDQMIEDGLLKKEDFVKGLDNAVKQVDGLTSTLLIYDDLQDEVAANDQVGVMFKRGSHHRNCSVIFIVQNIFFQGKKCRDIGLNAHYYVIFKNPSDKRQIANFACRTGDKGYFMDVYKLACGPPHGNMILDFSQNAQEGNIMSGMPPHFVYKPISDQM